ncbi:hypothetical protein MOBT1_002276 [Malassezia obtusa]|uniref:Uncharacterized protein n=1 Tax=Malassezia obtusa TaxID=76774 RepID=A0AAF0E5P8_9BASI|nr:hypothetical protein MOBT1_002276 [Malassezia obtusa]
MAVVTALGLLSGVLVRRQWRIKRQQSMERANAKLWQTDPHSAYLEKTWEHPAGDEEQATHVLYNVPESPPQEPQPSAPDAPADGPTSPGTAPMPLPAHDDDVRFPHAIAEQAQRPSVQWTRNTIPASLQSGTGASPRGQPASFKNKLSLSRSLSRSLSPTRSRMPSIRLSSPHHSRPYNRRSMLARLPSNFRSARPSRRVSPSSQDGDSIGMPEGEIPMARRIERGQTRFQYDSSSYGSSHGGIDWDEYIVEPDTADVAVPAPAVLAAPREPVDPDQFLHERIAAWQETSVNADAPGEHDEVPELPMPLGAGPLQRSKTQSTVQSSYSRASEEEYTNPYMQQQPAQLMRIPSIRPQFAAETTLESWLADEDPRVSDASSTDRGSGLFTEVEFATAAGESASEAHSLPRDMLAVPSPDRLAPVGGARTSLYAPRTPSPLGMHTTTSVQPYEPSMSSRSSFPASARMSNDSPRDWKHHSNTTASTELTWADESSAAADGSPGAALVKLERERSLRQAAADRVAQANKAWGVGQQDAKPPQERVLLPKTHNYAPHTHAMPGRFSMESSSASSESVRTEDGPLALDPLGTPALGSPLQTIQAYFDQPSGEKHDTSLWAEGHAIYT